MLLPKLGGSWLLPPRDFSHKNESHPMDHDSNSSGHTNARPGPKAPLNSSLRITNDELPYEPTRENKISPISGLCLAENFKYVSLSTQTEFLVSKYPRRMSVTRTIG